MKKSILKTKKLKKSDLKNKIQILEDVEYTLIEENNNLRLLVEALRNIRADMTEKRFRTIQKTVSRLQDEIKIRDRKITQLKTELREKETK